MFGVSFSEILVIFFVALLVLGPDRLPRVLRTLGFVWGRVVSVLNRLRFDLEQEMHQSDLRRMREGQAEDGYPCGKDE
ncbi:MULTISPECIES: Sec-independent protein translocase subunit TatA/TatB [Candidatus Ichthyocystis]|uniref:Putative Sec-independent protein translocase protein n=1 Tax=Candidatus Ichthyocystis hellenicum TaxID=1561003 RepID=A0A0S4M0N1_9BURK|nr:MULTISPECIES: twin-arginine translocase TatA/TatE family subunit [Ichthyocystis]CUT17153.1 putative Sec-independent protein translocase protein [Candidatus Ichthyocystis hellenicum]